MKRSYSYLHLLLATSLLLLGAAQARFFIGFPISAQVTESALSSYVGFSLGTYDLGRGFGLRGGLEFRPTRASSLYFQGGADLLYTSGDSTVFYAGAGGGYASADGAESLYVAGTAGLDFDAASLISFFVEAQPRYNLTTEDGLFYLRAGLNLHLGE